MRSISTASHHFLEDVAAIAESGCTAIVCLPLLPSGGQAGGSSSRRSSNGWAGSSSSRCSSDGPPCLGALTVGFTSDEDINSTSLKGALLLAHALAREQREALEEQAALVSSLLLPPPAGAGDAAGSDGWESEPEAGWEPSESDGEAAEEGWREGQHTASRDGGATGSSGSGAGTAAAQQARAQRDTAGACSGGTASQPFSLGLLSFGTAEQERAFASYHARHMQRVDLCAYAICLAFFCMEAFVPGTPFFLVQRMGWRCLLGFVGLLPGALLLSKRTRGWFAACRDLLLAFTWAGTTIWLTSNGNYMHVLERATFRNPLYLRSFGWLTVVGLAFQMRFRFQLAAATLAFAVNCQLLPAICEAFYDDLAPARCLMLGLLRVALHGVALPLACCYVFESHARRLFLRAQAGGKRRPASALLGLRASCS
ncbi:hypothetical protein ABPG75_002462 [Micractinium tetrahymenae]